MRKLTAFITLVAYVGSTFSPYLAYANEEPSAPHPTGVVSAPAESADGAKRVEGGSLSTAGDRSSAVAVGEGPSKDGGGSEKPGSSTSGDSGDGTSSESPEGESETPATETPSTDTLGLPSGDDKSGVTGQAISIPKGSGSIEGMGESFSAQLSTGIATFSVPFSLPKARGGAKPSLGLSYSSGGGNGPVGQGWSVGVPFIARQTDRGLPAYNDKDDFDPAQDTFVFNGGQELVPICTVSSGSCTGALANEKFPTDLSGYQYFRPRVEGSFLRFFWSGDHKTWVVQDKSGTTMELGKPRNGADESALEKNPNDATEIYRWHLVRQYDQHVSESGAPLNVVLYRYASYGNQAYVTDIFDTPPLGVSSPSDASFAGHTHLRWEDRPDVTDSYRSGYLIQSTKRLAGVDVTSKTFQGGSSGERHQVRRYHLSYASEYHHSLLKSVQVEGRCSGSEDTAPTENGEQELASSTSCPRLPPMTFDYTKVEGYQPGGAPDSKHLDGEMPFDGRVQTLTGSPKHSLDETLTDFFDINADGLPDVLVTAPGLYSNGHAVFFNGESGEKGFGGFKNMNVSGVLNAGPEDIKLSNLNLSPQDYDGDGRINLVHMPKTKKYAVYDPLRIAGKWTWVGHEVTTASGQTPKIDFGKDTRDTQAIDVNYDGLVDVVVSTGTEFQTFFSLGAYPNGEGQFGQAERTGPDSAIIKNTPVTTCVPYGGTAVQFGDSDIKLGDMNGDGITDIVRIRRGDIQYWPGRGNGFWGTGKRNDCAAGTFGANRYVEMNSAPSYSDIEGSTLKLNDVNGDGLDDLVQINFDSVDVYINVDGKSWTVRHILDKTPYHAGYANRVRLTDVNGSGTPDIVWGDSSAYKYIDLAGGQKPNLLIGVANGLGKTTSIEYSTSSEEMRAAEKLGACNPTSGADPWSMGWCKKAPMVSSIVKRVTERDNITIHGRPPAAYVTEYDYRDPVFEGRQREFRGYSRARARRLGDANSPTDVSESVFLLGECLGSDGLAWDGKSLDHECAPPNRWKDNAQEALKGLPFETHKFDLAGVHLSSSFNNYRIRTLYTGRDGRLVRHSFLAETDTVLYDTTANLPSRASLNRKGFIDEGKPTSEASTIVSAGAIVPDTVPPIQSLPSGAAHLRTRSEVDLFGNQLRSIDFGCVEGACPTTVPSEYVRADETLTKETKPVLLPHASGWMWRTSETKTLGSTHAEARGVSTVVYDSLGRPIQASSLLAGAIGLDRDFAISLPSGAAADGTFIASTTKYDAVGNALRSRGQNGRCAQVGYDTAYGTFATSETIFTNGTGVVTDIESPCNGASLISTASYDRGLGVVTVASDLNERDTKAVYDGFGRIVALHKPSATITSVPSYSAAPSVTMDYLLPGCEGCATPSLASGAPHSIIHSKAQDGASETDTGNYLESYAYVDGFGRTLVTLAEADPTEDGFGWVAGSLLEWDQKSAVSKKYMPYFFSGDPLAFDYAGDVTTPYGGQRYDAFGRQTQTYDLDGTVTLQSKYHALSTDLWDAADLYPGPHRHSYASERKDGHGRSVETIERFRDNGVMEERFVRTYYLPTGEPELIARVRSGSTPIVRWMRYDTLGRMVLNVEPNTTKDFSADLNANADAMDAWRYQYNLAGDLIGTSDARGCGQNFFYDSAGRIAGEDYAPCETHQAPYTKATSGSDTENLEVAYFYDSASAVPQKPSDWTPSFTKGRAIAVFDRASASFTTFDGRGRTTKSQTRVARPKAPGAAAPTLANRYAPRVYARSFSFDAADREVSATTGVEELRTASNLPKVPEFLAPGAAAGSGSTVTTTYTKRGTVKKSGSSYGTLIADIDRTADGLVTKVEYGDAAATRTSYLYDERRRISSVQTYRGPPASGAWINPSASEPTQQLVLQDEDFSYDVVGNPVEIHDWRDPADWPSGAKPVSKKIEYDDLYRATKVDYVYSTGDDAWKSPFESENAAVQSGNPNSLDPRQALPTPQVSFSKRVLRQTFEYDWAGNTDKTTDNESGFYDRSLGAITNDASGGKPYQLKHAELVGTRGGFVDAKYDEAGSMIRMDLRRDGSCLPTTASCSQIYDYQWDEVGRLVRARRWDVAPAALNGALPTGTPAADLRYAYNAGDQRVVKDAVDNQSLHSHTLYVFPTLELRRAEYGATFADTVAADNDYEVSTWSVVAYLLAHGVRIGRLAYEESSVPSGAVGNTDANGQLNASTSQLHVFFELGDHLGSTSVVLDKATGELVERSTFEGYGSTESDYRPGRWKNFREDYKFTGKEEDVEVGLAYFGKRFLNAHLGRWISADPLAIHAPGKADLNVYAYVSGSILKNVDPLGLEEAAASSDASGKGSSSDAPDSDTKQDDDLDATEKFIEESNARLDAETAQEEPTKGMSSDELISKLHDDFEANRTNQAHLQDLRARFVQWLRQSAADPAVSKTFAKDAKNENRDLSSAIPFPEGTNKCNCVPARMLEAQGMDSGNNYTTDPVRQPPSAADWANAKQVPAGLPAGWKYVGKLDDLTPILGGDVVAYKIGDGSGENAHGHMEVAVDSNNSAGAHSNGLSIRPLDAMYGWRAAVVRLVKDPRPNPWVISPLVF